MSLTEGTSTIISRSTAWLLLPLFLLSGCSLIDEDLSDCNPTEEATLDYELRLVTNMTTEVQTQLTAQTDVALAATLKEHLSGIFTDFAKDVDLSFYDTQGDSLRLHHDEHIMNASERSYTLYIPRQKYMHLAVANIVDDPLVDLINDERCHDSQISLREPIASTRSSFGPTATAPALAATATGDTIDSQTTGLFTARQLMEMIEGVNQTFNVKLYMANCAAAVVIDPRGNNNEDIQVYTTGFATAFNIADSSYTFRKPAPIVRTTKLQANSQNGDNLYTDSLLCFCSVTFPSPEPDSLDDTRSVIETTEPFIAKPGERALWEVRIYVTLPDGSITESILGIREPLRAGQLKIIRCWLGNKGQVETNDHTLGVSVAFDWGKGTQYDPEL